MNETKMNEVNETNEHPYKIGEPYFFRLITHHYTGRLVAVYPKELVIEDAAWIADDGRFSQALKTGIFEEIEPYPDGQRILNREAVLDAGIFPHPLPREVK